MKRRIWAIVVLLFVCILGYRYCTIPEYKIRSSMSIGGSLERETILRVIVYKNHYDKRLVESIEDFFLKMNGYPATLQIELYFEGSSAPYKTVKFEYQ